MSSKPISPTRHLRVLVVDADARVRDSLAGLLGIGRRCIVVGTAGEPGAALALAVELEPDVVLIDPRVPEIDAGRNLIAALRAQVPDVRVLVMGWSDAIDPGAVGGDAFVRKTYRPHELVDAVLAAGGTRVGD